MTTMMRSVTKPQTPMTISGHHQVGARERAAVHDHRAEPGGHAGHLADHDQDPGEAVRDAQSVEDRGREAGNTPGGTWEPEQPSMAAASNSRTSTERTPKMVLSRIG